MVKLMNIRTLVGALLEVGDEDTLARPSQAMRNRAGISPVRDGHHVDLAGLRANLQKILDGQSLLGDRITVIKEGKVTVVSLAAAVAFRRRLSFGPRVTE
jgi:hypothetical protein